MCNCTNQVELDGQVFCKNDVAIRILDHSNGCYNLDIIEIHKGKVVKPLMALYEIGCAFRMAVQKTDELGLKHENFQYATTENTRVVYA